MNIVKTDGPVEDRISFSDEEIEVVKKALGTKLFAKNGGTIEERLVKFQTMLNELAEVFAIAAPQLVLVKNEEGEVVDQPGFQTNPDDNTIHVGRLSLVSILNAFSFSLHRQTENAASTQDVQIPSGDGDGDDNHVEPVSNNMSPAFGMSAFKQASPKMFDSALQGGRLIRQAVPYTDGGKLPLGPTEEPTFGDTAESDLD